MKPAIFMAFFILLLSSISYAGLIETIGHGQTMTTGGSNVNKYGLKVTVKEDMFLISINKTISTANMSYVYNASGTPTLLGSVAFVGNRADYSSQNILLISGQSYLLIADSSGANYQDSDTDTPVLPVDQSKVNWTSGAYYLGSWGYNNYVYNILSIDVIYQSRNLSVISNQFANYSINFTSDGGKSCGYNVNYTYSSCGETEDGTPTVKFDTTGSASCKIWNQAKNYSTLGSEGVPDCGTTGGASHICTYSQKLPYGNQTIYISCKSGNYEITNFSMYPYNIFNITILQSVDDSQSYANEAIESGIMSSSIWPGALIYTFQPVYIRTKENNQAYGVFDKVAVYGNQRWAFNYRIENETSMGTFYNISPVFYFWERANLTYIGIRNNVGNFINSTKN